MRTDRIRGVAAQASIRRALLATTMLSGAATGALVWPELARAQATHGGFGASNIGFAGFGGGYQQDGQAGAPLPNGAGGGGGGGGPGPVSTLGGAAGNASSGAGGAGGVNGVTQATMPLGSVTGGNGGNATPSSDGTTKYGGGGGAGGYGVALTTTGPFTTTAGQVFTGGVGGAGNGALDGGAGGDGGGGLILEKGGTFTNVLGASLIGGAQGPSSTKQFWLDVNFGGPGLTATGYGNLPLASATVINAGIITGGAGGTLFAVPGAPAATTGAFNFGGYGIIWAGGSITNTATGVITGGVGGAGFPGTPTQSPGRAGFGGSGIGFSVTGSIDNSGLIVGGAGLPGTVAAPGSRPDDLSTTAGGGDNRFSGGFGGTGVELGSFLPTATPPSLVNNSTGVIKGGAGADGGSGLVDPASPRPAAGGGGGGGLGIEALAGSILNFGLIAGGSAGHGANATAAGQVGGGGAALAGGGTGVGLEGAFGAAGPVSLDNRGTITGGAGGAAGTSGAGAAGAAGGKGGDGVSTSGSVSGPSIIINSGQISGGNGGAGSAGSGGAANGTTGAGGVGINMKGDGTITTSGGISGGLSGDGATRANAITFLSGVHTLTLQTGATFAGNVVVDTAGISFGSPSPGVPANNTLNLDGASSGTISLPQFQNFGHLTQTGGAGGTWTLTGAGAFTVDTTVSAGTMVLDAGSTLTSPAINVLTGGTLSLSTAALANDALTINGGTLQVTGNNLNSLPNAIALGASGGTFDIVSAANAFTISQAFGGGGALIKAGAGTLVFTGDHTYTGGTTIASGTLQLGNGGTSGSITGNVANNASLIFNRSDAVAFGGSISGTGAVQHNGSGSTNLTGASNYTGPTTINAGTLAVNGSITSAVTVNSGGTLMGAGTVGGINAMSGGTVAPGNSIGTLNVVGPVAFGPGSTYQVEANAAGQSDKIVVTGPATLTGGTVQVLATPGNYAANTVYNILHASSVTGTFAGVTTNLAFLAPSLSYDADDVFLTLVRNASAFSTVAQTFNQRAVAGALDASAFGSTLVQAILPLTAPQSLVAFDQLSGEVHASTAGVLVDESRYMRGAVLSRLRQVSYGGDSQMASLSMGGPVVAFADGELDSALAYGKSPIVTKAPRMAPAPGPDIAFWAQGFGARGSFDGDGNAASVKRDLAGFITGFDARFGNWRGGIAAGYTGSRNNTDGRGSANVDTGHVAAYGGVSVGALNLRAGGAYAFHQIDTDRTVVFPGFFDRATARYQGGTGQIFGEAGYGFAFGRVAIEPFAGAAWVHLSTDAANEQGGAAALALAANKFEVGYSTLGVRAATMIPIGSDMVLVPRASAAWQHAFNTVTPLAALAFQSTGAAFVVAGVPIARDALLAEAGLDLGIGRNTTLGVSYVGQLASNVRDHAAKGKFTYRF